MIGTERLAKILRIISASGHVKDSFPISAILIGPSDGGKSRLLMSNLPPDAQIVTDFTYAGVLTLLQQPTPPSYVVIPDFNTIVGHKPAVAQLTMTVLLAVLAEGVADIPGLDGKMKVIAKTFKGRGHRLAMLTALTPDVFFSKRGKWREIGFLRRFAPIYFTYTAATIAKIQGGITRGDDTIDYSRASFKHTDQTRGVRIPITIARDIEALSAHVTSKQLVWHVGQNSGNNSQRVQKAQDLPFSPHKILRAFLKSAAFVHNHGTATRRDFDTTIEFSKFMRYDRPEEL